MRAKSRSWVILGLWTAPETIGFAVDWQASAFGPWASTPLKWTHLSLNNGCERSCFGLGLNPLVQTPAPTPQNTKGTPLSTDMPPPKLAFVQMLSPPSLDLWPNSSFTVTVFGFSFVFSSTSRTSDSGVLGQVTTHQMNPLCAKRMQPTRILPNGVVLPAVRPLRRVTSGKTDAVEFRRVWLAPCKRHKDQSSGYNWQQFLLPMDASTAKRSFLHCNKIRSPSYLPFLPASAASLTSGPSSDNCNINWKDAAMKLRTTGSNSVKSASIGVGHIFFDTIHSGTNVCK